MLCPSCGTSVGDNISLCINCEESQRLARSALNAQTPDVEAVEELPEESPEAEAPPKEKRERKNTAELRALYDETMGYTQNDELREMLLHPKVLGGSAIFCFLFLSLVYLFGS